MFNEINVDNIAILGFGKEGRSSYLYIRSNKKYTYITILDININLKKELQKMEDPFLFYNLGDRYLDNLEKYDLILRSPGINYSKLDNNLNISSQTEIFLTAYRSQVIGITGSKGKSSSSTLLYKLLKSTNQNVFFAGNIGIPPFDIAHLINSESIVILELSCHQLQSITVSPKYAILLNLFEEHLDYYPSRGEYFKTKFNIARYQLDNDIFLINDNNENIRNYLPKLNIKSKVIKCSTLRPEITNQIIYIDKNKIKSKIDTQYEILIRDIAYFQFSHFLENSLMVLNLIDILDIPLGKFINELNHFRGLEHRLEIIGNYNEITFINDSISTIPESTIAALKAFKKSKTLILGGKDRGVNYQNLISFLGSSDLDLIICMDETGKEIYNQLSTLKKEMNLFFVKDLTEAIKKVYKFSEPNTSCLFSPGASSYNHYKNFEERGKHFASLVKSFPRNSLQGK